MRSLLEHETDLIAGMGLVTTRWATLEHELAQLLGYFLKIEQAAEPIYYSLGNFSQRVDLIENVFRACLINERHTAIIEALMDRVRRLWKKRNYLIHSHYVYTERGASGFGTTLVSIGSQLGPHPKLSVVNPKREEFYDESGRLVGVQEKTLEHGFAYVERKMGASPRYVFVNRGTFQNHADQLLKRSRQTRALHKRLMQGLMPLRQTALRSSDGRPHPRSPQNRS
jgi:hypothetical protein